MRRASGLLVVAGLRTGGPVEAPIWRSGGSVVKAAWRAGRWVVVATLVAGCAAPVVTDYRASPVVIDHDWGDRLFLERSGVRVLVGPASVFPYERIDGAGVRERGRYQLFTRVVVENAGETPVLIHWDGVRLESEEGASYRLVESGYAAARVRGLASEPEAGPEMLEPGASLARAFIPETLFEIGVDEPMVALCDGCEYRLVVPVTVGAVADTLVLPFRLTARRPTANGGRWPWAGSR